MRTLKALLAVATLSALTTVAAQASTLDTFTYSLSGVPGTGTATLAASPTPSSFVNGLSFTLDNVSTAYLGTTLTGDITFFTTGGAMGAGEIFSGPVLFSGPVTAPTFNLGTFTLFGRPDLGNGPTPVTATLTIASNTPTAPTPEPATLALVGTAALGLAGAVRRRLS